MWNTKISEEKEVAKNLPFFEPKLAEYFLKAKVQGNIKFVCSDF